MNSILVCVCVHVSFGSVGSLFLRTVGCNCSLNKRLSGVARLPFTVGLHSVPHVQWLCSVSQDAGSSVLITADTSSSPMIHLTCSRHVSGPLPERQGNNRTVLAVEKQTCITGPLVLLFISRSLYVTVMLFIS